MSMSMSTSYQGQFPTLPLNHCDYGQVTRLFLSSLICDLGWHHSERMG